MSQNKDNQGAIFKNDTEGKSENFPPYGGSATINGQEFWVSAWVKEGTKGKFFSLAFKPKEARANPPPRKAPDVDPFDTDSIPF